MREWTWESGSVLDERSPYTPPAEIFGAVCGELGRYYSERGAKYTRSNHKLKFGFEKVRCELGFRSSHSNTAGEWVNLEIITSVYALDKSGMEKNGLLFVSIRPKNFNVYGIDQKLFFEIIDYIDEKLELVKSLQTADGIRAHYGEEKFLGEHPNNSVYFKNLST